METDTEYYGLYALKNLLGWPALHRVLRRRKQIKSARTVAFRGGAQTGKTIALHHPKNIEPRRRRGESWQQG